MINEVKNTLLNNLEKMYQEISFKNRTVAVFGATRQSSEIINFLTQRGITVSAIFDNNPVNQELTINNVKVYAPEVFLSEYIDNLLVIICSIHAAAMMTQLTELGYHEGTHIHCLGGNPKKIYNVSKTAFDKCANNLLAAFDFLSTIHATQIVLCPYKNIGDTFIGCSSVAHKIVSKAAKGCCILVLSESCRKTASMFGFENIIIIQPKLMYDLIQCKSMLGHTLDNVYITQPCNPYYNASLLTNMQGYKNLSAVDFFKTLPDRTVCEIMEPPVDTLYISAPQDTEEITKLFYQYHLKPHKTAILSPNSNSLPPVSESFWINTATELEKKGYTICVNATENETGILDYPKILFPLDIFSKVCEMAGLFIGLRSGLCDCISFADCRKIIVYPKRASGFARCIDFFSLRNIHDDGNLTEIEAD